MRLLCGKRGQGYSNERFSCMQKTKAEHRWEDGGSIQWLCESMYSSLHLRTGLFTQLAVDRQGDEANKAYLPDCTMMMQYADSYPLRHHEQILFETFQLSIRTTKIPGKIGDGGGGSRWGGNGPGPLYLLCWPSLGRESKAGGGR